MSSIFQPSPIDTEILDICQDLNDLGYITEESCCGIPGHSTASNIRPYVVFTSSFEKADKLITLVYQASPDEYIRWILEYIPAYGDFENSYSKWNLRSFTKGSTQLWDLVRNALKQLTHAGVET